MRKLVLFCILLAACGSSSPPASGGYGPFYTRTGGGGGGTIALNVNVTRTTGISPLTIWYDATTSTDNAVTTPYMDLTCVWNFGDTGASGTGTWSTGNQSFNSMNAGRGLIAAHTYVVPDGSGDKTYTASVTCHDVSGNSATGNATQVAVYDPIGANGFSAANTTCFFNATLGTGCPAGASSLLTSSLSTALSSTYVGNNKRVLFKCGDTFTGQAVALPSATKFFVGAYGSCVGTKTNRPKFSANNTGTYPDNSIVMIGYHSAVNIDGRFSDIECDGNTFNNNGCVAQLYDTPTNGTIIRQITMYNMACVGCWGDFSWNGGAEVALVWSSKDDSHEIGTFLNSGSYWHSSSWVTTNCPDGTKVTCLDYQAVIGNDLAAPSLQGTTPGSGIENVRMMGGRYVVISNNWIRDASTNGPMLKMNCADNDQDLPWLGDIPYCKYIEISDNHFGKHATINDAAKLVEIAPQDGGSDERWAYLVFENNFLDNASPGSRSMEFSGQHMVMRGNIFWMTGNDLGVQIWTKGSIQTSTFPTTDIQVYNNTLYDPAMADGTGLGIYLGTQHGANSCANPTSVVVKNNLCYSTVGLACAHDDSGLNTLSNNTATLTNNPGFTNGSTTLSVETDYKPTANYTGGASVSVYTDILGIVWPPTWDLGAVHH